MEIIEKIQKLLALANSSNENEAKIASQKAQALLIKYNISLSEVEMINQEYINKTTASQAFVKPHQKYIHSILNSYFFVSIVSSRIYSGHTIDGRRKFKYDIKFGGTKENIEIATYVNNFLENCFISSWNAYKKENGLSEKHRNTYMLGLYRGIVENLEKSKEQAKNEYAKQQVQSQNQTDAYALALKNFDLITSCNEITKKAFPDTNIKTKTANIGVSDKDHLDNGYDDGKKVAIRKGLNSNSDNSGKLLR